MELRENSMEKILLLGNVCAQMNVIKKDYCNFYFLQTIITQLLSPAEAYCIYTVVFFSEYCLTRKKIAYEFYQQTYQGDRRR